MHISNADAPHHMLNGTLCWWSGSIWWNNSVGDNEGGSYGRHWGVCHWRHRRSSSRLPHQYVRNKVIGLIEVVVNWQTWICISYSEQNLFLLVVVVKWILFGIVAMDISADLKELGRTAVTVVSAGIKSILDIRRTLEYLVRVLRYLVLFIILLYRSLYSVSSSTFLLGGQRSRTIF